MSIELVRRDDVVARDGVFAQIGQQRLQRPIMFRFDVGCSRIVATVGVGEKKRSTMLGSKVELMGAIVGVGVLLEGSAGRRRRSSPAEAGQRNCQLGGICDRRIGDSPALVKVAASRIEQIRIFLIRFPGDARCLEQSREILSAQARIGSQKCRNRRDTITCAVRIVIIEDPEIGSSLLPNVIRFGRVDVGGVTALSRQDVMIGRGIGDIASVRVTGRDEAVEIRRGRAAE